MDENKEKKEKNEFQIGFEHLLRLEDLLKEHAVPEEKRERLIETAHSKIYQRTDIEGLMAIIKELPDLLEAYGHEPKDEDDNTGNRT